MGFDFLSRAARFLQERKEYRRWLTAFICLALVVAFGTVTALKMYGQAMTHQVKVLDCQYQVHEHTEDCYEENEDGEKILVCGLADYVIHVHNDDCYDAKQNLVCPLEEREPHEHSDDCYEEEKTLICEEEESEGSTEEKADDQEAPDDNEAASEETTDAADETDNSSDEDAGEDTSTSVETHTELVCEIEEHSHGDGCYAEGGGCDKEEHTHGEGCYEKELTCEAQEHTHGDGCYTTSEEMTCGAEEHSHGDGCYDEEGNLTCEEEEHSHDDGCYTTSEELTCTTDEHSHGDGCYTETLVCETEEHTHDDSCEATSELICDKEEHSHEDSCYQEVEVEKKEEKDSEPAPKEQEEKPQEAEQPTDYVKDTGEKEVKEGHTHNEDCYETKEVMACEEQELHTHDDSCYEESCFDEDGNLIEGSRVSCGLLQLEEHVHNEECFKTVELTPEEVAALNGGAKLHMHTEECYDEEGNLICGHEATHLHSLDCYNEEGKLICGYGTASHVHEDSCYDEEGNLTCGYETATHVHEDSCYDEEGNLICGYETATHVHEDSCYDENGNLICGYETATHVHEDSCYDENGNLICDYETATHIHEDSCYDENGNLICGYETEKAHEHDANCYDEEGNLTCGYEDAKDHEHDATCYDEEGNLICGYEGVKNHEHDADCYDIRGNFICGYEGVEDHVHTDACYDAEGNLICGFEVLEAYDNCKIYESDKYIVVVKYNDDAKIPEEAELIAEEITPDSDEEHYGNREIEYREMMEDETASMRALLKIGFYLEGEEVEPESLVAVSIQFKDEDGLAEGKPITVIHFAEEGTERLNGSNAKDNSTTFKMGSFSEIAIGYGSEETEENTKFVKTKVRVSKLYEYEESMFRAKFHVEGEVLMPDGLLNAENSELLEKDVASIQEDEGRVADDNEIKSNNETDITEGNEPLEQEVKKNSKTETNEELNGETKEEKTEDALILTEEELTGTMEFVVELLDEESEEYKAAEVVYGDDSEEIFLNQVLSYYLSYNGVKLDLSACNVTVEVIPTQELVDYAEETMAIESDDGEKLRDEVTFSIIDFMAAEDVEKNTATEGISTADQTEMVGSGVIDGEDTEQIEASGDELESNTEEDVEKTDKTEPEERPITGEILDAVPVTSDSIKQPIQVTLNAVGTDNAVAATVSSQANPTFTVQFYAWMDTLAEPKPEEVEKSIKVIDTSGKKPPTNGGTMSKKNIKVESDGTVRTESKLTEIYSESSCDYISAPGLVYFNKIAKNNNYILKEIQVQRNNNTTWETYSCENGKEWHFTNKEATKNENKDEFILITANAKIKLVHTVKEQEVSNGVNFYDYDISDGNLYTNTSKSQTVTRGNATTHNSGNTWYMYTNRQGINSNSADQTFGFGNSEGTMKTTMGEIVGNKANSQNSLYGSPTFGLVTGLKDGKLQYAGNVKAPNLFNEGSANGKSPYAGDLIFSQKGDTYTLTGAEVKEQGAVVSSVYDLDKFTRQRDNWNHTYYFAGNDFYPLDGVSSAGTNGHDLMFGAENTAVLKNFSKINTTTEILNAPTSDDGKNHNHYFGMHYTVDFDLVKDYVGPLEYLFYGDDDMWVFLDGPGYSGKLICDIGGVHSSVGEYVNLWDYIKKGSEGHYTLTFFYTERGASGSTCWMQFTLPSVSFATTEQDTGELRVEKKVTGTETSEEFGFEIHFTDASGKNLMDDYSYTKFNSENDVVENDILIWNNSKFTLKAGEYIVIKFLPDGSTYTINEVGPVTVKPKEPGDGTDWESVNGNNPYTPEITGGNDVSLGVVTGNISKDSIVKIEYNNILKFTLPETGGSGMELYTIAGVLCILCSAGFLYKKKFRERRA